jgi:hypothetical protein
LKTRIERDPKKADSFAENHSSDFQALGCTWVRAQLMQFICTRDVEKEVNEQEDSDDDDDLPSPDIGSVATGFWLNCRAPDTVFNGLTSFEFVVIHAGTSEVVKSCENVGNFKEYHAWGEEAWISPNDVQSGEFALKINIFVGTSGGCG